MSLQKIVYTAQAKVTGGREGHVTSNDGRLSLQLSTPRELGGSGGGSGTNPEQLFAAGYSACFLGALRFVAGQDKIALPDDSTVLGIVGLGPVSQGFGIQVELKITIPGMDREEVQNLVARAHQICPYSNATRGNIKVSLMV